MIRATEVPFMPSLFEGQNLSRYPLRQALFDEYGFPDRRVKNIERMTKFRVDVKQSAKGADGNPLSSICTIWVKVETEDQITVDLGGSLPLDGAVKVWTDSMDPVIAREYRGALSLSLHSGNQGTLASLAKAMRARNGRNQPPYTAASHPFSSQETAQGLDKLKKVLDAVWK
jgi:hypothetical protein